MGPIAIVGGTGPEGLGLALRLAALGEEVIVGSRDLARAQAAAARVSAALPAARIRAAVNPAAVAAAETVVLAMPYAGVADFVAAQAEALAGKIVIDVVVPLRFESGVARAVPVAEGSVGEQIARLAPRARVVAAFKNLSAEHLAHLETPLEGDILVCADDDEARRAVCTLAGRIPDLRAVDAGPLAGAAALEQLTVLLLNVNRRYRAVTSVRLVGL